MGYLDHSTNSLILDAVLTDTGRMFLARNDSSFSLHKFALGDDEIDYTIIQQYGRQIGSEKIEKNTPVFEALTNQDFAQKYRLISISNPNLVHLPVLSLSGDAAVNGPGLLISLGRNIQRTSTLSIEQTIQNETSIDVELRDQTFIVEVNNMFLEVLRSAPDSIDGYQRATYILTRSPNQNNLQGSIVQFTVNTKSLSDAQFAIYGSTANKNIINTFAKVTGAQSGAVIEFQVSINKTL